MYKIQNKGWIVTFAGFGINLALGIIYTWSIFKETITTSIIYSDGRFAWDLSKLNHPYAICCLVITFSMIIAGYIQDKIGPRITAIIGSIFIGLGLIWCSTSYFLSSWIIGYGLLMGIGIGFSDVSAIPPAVKWFPSNKTGLIIGIIGSGIGLAPVYIAPSCEYLINNFGMSNTMLILGLFSFITICGLAQFLTNPPNNYISDYTIDNNINNIKILQYVTKNFSTKEMIKTKSFYKIWIICCLNAGVGLMVISDLTGMAKKTLGDLSWIVIVLMALGSTSGRILIGLISDKLGRIYTLAIILSMQSIWMFVLFIINNKNPFFMTVIIILVGFNYGASLALFPSTVRDFFGLKNFGTNYGLMMTSWGIGGFILPQISQLILINTNSYNLIYILAGTLLAISTGLTLITKSPKII